MKIDKKLIKELVENLKEFNLTELDYQDGQTKIKVSKSIKGYRTIKNWCWWSHQTRLCLNTSDDSDGVRIKVPYYRNCLFST